ncbi:MAG: STAS domain-containing protein [Bryobacteraceae bacterium]|nr:STAS domain-containing protein [Bryobacteraceae bacterium]
MSVTLKTRETDGVAILQASGRVTLGEATGQVREAVRNIVAQGHRKVVLNLQNVSYMDSAGLGEVISAYTTMRNQGGDMKLVGVTGRALDLLQVTRLTTLFEFFDNETAAVASFR